jgi:hypothetical protein
MFTSFRLWQKCHGSSFDQRLQPIKTSYRIVRKLFKISWRTFIHPLIIMNNELTMYCTEWVSFLVCRSMAERAWTLCHSLICIPMPGKLLESSQRYLEILHTPQFFFVAFDKQALHVIVEEQ